MIDGLALVALLVGVFFMFVASLGVLRLKDFYLRIHAPTKAATLGLVFLLLSVVLTVQDKTVLTKAFLAVLFIAATAPVGAHLLSRAAYRNNVARSPDTEIDEYAAVVQGRKGDPRREPIHARDLDA